LEPPAFAAPITDRPDDDDDGPRCTEPDLADGARTTPDLLEPETDGRDGAAVRLEPNERGGRIVVIAALRSRIEGDDAEGRGTEERSGGRAAEPASGRGTGARSGVRAAEPASARVTGAVEAGGGGRAVEVRDLELIRSAALR
jgi:hypothetical protein